MGLFRPSQEGRYTIERELGEGGMATVYFADALKHERKIALKVLKPELAAVVGAERFRPWTMMHGPDPSSPLPVLNSRPNGRRTLLPGS